MDFELTTSWNPALNEKIEGQIKGFLEQKTGIYHVFKPGAIYVYQDSALIGGAIFEIQGRSLWVDSLWINIQFQRQGIATRLIKQLSEFAQEQECEFLQLNTYFGQTFFQKVGFEVMAMIPKWKYGLNCYFMRKAL